MVEWKKQWDGLRQFKLTSTEKVSAAFVMNLIAYYLIGSGNLLKSVMAVA